VTGFGLLARRRVSAAAALGAALAAALLWEGAASGAPLPLALLLACLTLAAWLIRDDLLRARLAAQGGPGVVSVQEGRIAYFGPREGGVVDLDGIQAVEAARKGGVLVWTLRGADGTVLTIPAGAVGAEALLGALAALPGFDAAALVAGAERREAGPRRLGLLTLDGGATRAPAEQEQRGRAGS
jgi:hypothetical protein